MSESWQARAEAAERTTQILKQKVRALYNGEALPAMKSQLARAQIRHEDARRRGEQLERQTKELGRYSAALEIEVAARTADLRVVLDNVSSGFFVIDASLTVAPGHSRSCLALLGAAVVAGGSVVDLLGRGDRRTREAIVCSLRQVFEDVLPEIATLDAVPKRFVLGDRTLHATVCAIRDAKGDVQKVLLSLSDATQLEAAERRAWENEVLVGILRQRDVFAAFVEETRELLAAAPEALRNGDHVFVRRALHTIKGMAAAFDLSMLVEAIHEGEGHEAISESHIAIAAASLRDFLARHAAILNLPYDERPNDSFAISEATVNELRTITQVGKDDGVDYYDVERSTARVGLKRTNVLVGPLPTYAAKLAERLGKSVELVLTGGDVFVDARTTRAVFQNLSHLVRNAVDHGIEDPYARSETGKAAVGRVTVDVRDDDARWTVRVTDDGRGIDAEEVARTAVRKGFYSALQIAAMSHDEKLAVVFADGFSTADVATEVSGRGIGMSAIQAAVLSQGGDIAIETAIGKGTSVTLHIPKPEALRKTSLSSRQSASQSAA